MKTISYGISHRMELYTAACEEASQQLKNVGSATFKPKAAQAVADQCWKEEHATTRAGTSSPSASSDRGS